MSRGEYRRYPWRGVRGRRVGGRADRAYMHLDVCKPSLVWLLDFFDYLPAFFICRPGAWEERPLRPCVGESNFNSLDA